MQSACLSCVSFSLVWSRSASFGLVWSRSASPRVVRQAVRQREGCGFHSFFLFVPPPSPPLLIFSSVLFGSVRFDNWLAGRPSSPSQRAHRCACAPAPAPARLRLRLRLRACACACASPCPTRTEEANVRRAGDRNARPGSCSSLSSVRVCVCVFCARARAQVTAQQSNSDKRGWAGKRGRE